MSLSEFELIDRFFRPLSGRGGQITAGVGDDCALLVPGPDSELAVSTDTFVAGVHFPLECDPADLGWRGLAAAVSDLAAMGARPLGFTLALTLPEVDMAWLRAFTAGTGAASACFEIPLLGGDTTRGPLTLTWTVLGEVPRGRALRRGGAVAGDRVVVSGWLGEAAAALSFLEDSDRAPTLVARYLRPQPRLLLGQRLVGLAHAMIDLSDGLVADLGHVLEASGVGALLDVTALPLSDALVSAVGAERALTCALAGGDDYELCFTLPATAERYLSELSVDCGLPLTVIGKIVSEPGLRLLDEAGREMLPPGTGYRHFDGG